MVVFIVIIIVVIIFALLGVFISSAKLDITDEYEDDDSVDYNLDDEDYY